MTEGGGSRGDVFRLWLEGWRAFAAAAGDGDGAWRRAGGLFSAWKGFLDAFAAEHEKRATAEGASPFDPAGWLRPEGSGGMADLLRWAEGPELADLFAEERDALRASREWAAWAAAHEQYRTVVAGGWMRAFRAFVERLAASYAEADAAGGAAAEDGGGAAAEDGGGATDAGGAGGAPPGQDATKGTDGAAGRGEGGRGDGGRGDGGRGDGGRGEGGSGEGGPDPGDPGPSVGGAGGPGWDEILRIWREVADAEMARTHRSAAFLAAQRDLIAAELAVRKRLRERVERIAALLGLPTRSEVDDLHASVHALRRELRALRREGSG